MVRLGWLLWAFTCLPSPIISTSPTYLEQSIQDLNITDPEEVKLFVQEWTRPGAIKRLEFAPLASQLPTWDLPLGRHQDLVAEQIPEATAALRDRVVAELLKIQARELVTMLMRRAAILQLGSHFAAMKTRSVTMMPKHASTLREATFLHSLDAQLTLSRATVTETTTSWATETDTETVTTDGTTTVKTVSTIETTVSVTVSRGPTGGEPTGENTATDSDKRHKRFVPAAPHKHFGRDAPITKTIPPIVLHPAASLNALADALSRRGIPIHRRATDTKTVYETEKATTTITDTETKTEWTTKYSTSITTHKQTVTVFVQGQSTVTVGPKGTAASSSESGSGDGGPPKSTVIGAAVGGGLGLILITLLAFFLWRRRRKSANQTQQPSQFYAANSDAPALAQKPPPFTATTPTPMPPGARDTWASSPSRSDYSQPPAYPPPMPELGDTQFAYEMHTSPQRSPQELYHPQYMSGLGLPEMRDQRRG
ncbi:hypothetical protein FPCIR_2185 [Fusarium pseudocircinatum]|uniref:Mid2 domain-containing protein n=1 Tax=Fusarium pseudocircinatum TaxID=56676 RepID=A0A8H5PRD2_9HYPO|nr:hypothetical protein FPCIR_2185 [Fusarium pseudocircinatum]